MFANRIHNLYQRSFQFSSEEVTNLLTDSFSQFDSCLSKSKPLYEEISSFKQQSGLHKMILEQISKLTLKYESMKEIRQIILKNLEYFESVPSEHEEQSFDSNRNPNKHNGDFRASRKKKQKKISDEENKSARQIELYKSGIDPNDIKLDQVMLDNPEDLQSRRIKFLEQLDSQIDLEENKEDSQKAKENSKYLNRITTAEIKLVNSQLKPDEETKQQLPEFQDEEEVKAQLTQEGLNYDELDLEPFDLPMFSEYNTQLLKGEKLINIHATGVMLTVCLKVISTIDEALTKLTSRKEIQLPDFMNFVVQAAKLDIAEYILYSAFQQKEDLLFFQDRDKSDWQLLDEITTEVDLKNPKEYLKNIQKTLEGLRLGGAMMSKQFAENNPFLRFFKVIGFSSYYLVSKKNRNNQFQYFMANPNKEHLMKFFNIQENKLAINMYKLALPRIHIKQIIFVPMITDILTLQEAQTYEQNPHKTGNILMPIQSVMTDQNVNFTINRKVFDPKKMVEIRILSSTDLDVNFKTGVVRNPMPKQTNASCCLCFRITRQPPIPITKIEKIIIHFHGGGFVSMNSCLHQNYTRQWANELSVPIFSVDYRLCPKNPFPDPVNDCYQAYYWIMNQARSQLGIDPKQVVLTGDSAGGHLAAATTILSILRGFQVPTALLLHYPALCTDLNRFYPSTLIALDDPILNQSFLKFCLKSFTRNGGDASINPLMSPVVASDTILKKFPPTRIVACEADPLRDSSYEFALRLKKIGIDTQLYIMKDYIHGFNSFDMENFGVKEYHQGTLLTLKILRELLQLPEPKKKS